MILGGGIGLLAEYDVKGVLNGDEPRCGNADYAPAWLLLMEGLLPLSDAVRSFLKNVILTVTICISVWISLGANGASVSYYQLRCCCPRRGIAGGGTAGNRLLPLGDRRTFRYRFPWWYWPVEQAILSGRLSLAFHARR